MNPRALLPLLPLLLLFLANPALATPPIETLEPNLSRATLENGLEIYVVEDHALPLVTIEMAVKNGAFTESPDYNGLSHVYEHMFFKGNEVIPDQETYLARQRELGMLWNGTTGTERVNYFFTLTSDNWVEGLTFMRDAIRSPLFDEEELAKERIVILDEFSRNEAEPTFHLFKAMDDLVWYQYPSRKDSLGDREVIESVTREQMLTVQQRFYIPNNSALFIAGDITPEEALEEVEALYGDWEAGEDPFAENPIPTHPALKSAQATIVEQPYQYVLVRMVWHGPDIQNDPKATFAADVFNTVLGQRSAAFQKALIDSGEALYASIGYQTQRHTGPIAFTLVTTPDKVESALKAAAVELEKFTSPDYLSDDEIKTAKTLLEVSDIYSREYTTEFTHTLSYWWCSADIDYYLNYLDNLRAVTRQEMLDYLDTYMVGQPFVLGTLISPENHEAAGGFTEADLLQWFDPQIPKSAAAQ